MEIHPRFKFNGKSHSIQELTEVAYDLVKEGEKHEISIGDFLLDWLGNSKGISVSTSGSTGKPKKIQLQKKQMVNSALATGSFFNLIPGSSALLCLPCDFIAGKMMLVRAMVLGLELDYVKPNLNPISRITTEYDFTAMIPLQAQNSLNKLNSIKTLIIGGAPVGHDLLKPLGEIQASVYETYGMTETITHIAAKRLNKKSSIGENYFTVLPNISITKDNRDCLVIDAPKISDGKVTTNDIVELISENEFKWLGRYDSIINSGGIKLIPEQIEAKLSSVIKNRFFVAGIPDVTLGQKLVLLIEGGIDAEGLLSKIKSVKSLTKFEVPKAVLNPNQFIESSNGKILRAQTLQMALTN
ncbi:AMP-binding protein [Croceitalea sp. MTPC9]|uniref:AMP-binding protein n=1 Tax=unclassified Croceitalea TaxID=2632280 RepID=UPI002B3E2955|nr:AMP-binding protein [Croceitalea sp. MTPC6]GMN15889.1 AMP-binding protein [Croceitalea sp. MTPC9]